MNDVAQMTVEQGENLNKVELQINITHKNVEEAAKELNLVNFRHYFIGKFINIKAKKTVENIKCKAFLILGIVLIVVVVIILVVLYTK